MIKNTPILNNLSDTPGKKRKLYELVRDKIIIDMLSANLQPGDSYATEDELAQRLSVSRNTIRKAMAELETAGFIIRRQRVGAIVTAKACTGRLDTISTRQSSFNSSNPKLILVLPQWESNTGNYFSNIVLRELSTPREGQQKFIVEVRLFDDPLDDIQDDIQAILVVDPIQQTIPALSHWADKGVEIIAIETKTPLYMAINIRFNIFQAAEDAVRMLHQQGHKHIGIINQDITHDTFRQWLLGYIEAHRELNLPILPHAIIQVRNGTDPSQVKLDDITAWICTYNGGVNSIAQACHKQGLKIPENVAIIGSDDPGDVIVSSMGCTLTVTRPDYITLSRMIRQILSNDIVAMNGNVLDCPMKWIYRDSTSAVR